MSVLAGLRPRWPTTQRESPRPLSFAQLSTFTYLLSLLKNDILLLNLSFWDLDAGSQVQIARSLGHFALRATELRGDRLVPADDPLSKWINDALSFARSSRAPPSCAPSRRASRSSPSRPPRSASAAARAQCTDL
ncbi:hypothetical protein GGX14DRAFT_572651 [Mycena pura]|uniref:Uncharacterized protein n=1 Tax=Mycena pura TaxID=153505 RepID=A0AAD6V0B1_9AGAR|nr:hypothetical protein GGX14DRAFT_572651 [Mycena pura]